MEGLEGPGNRQILLFALPFPKLCSSLVLRSRSDGDSLVQTYSEVPFASPCMGVSCRG